MKLFECVDITYRDGTFLLQPKTKNEIDLVMLGFNGTEKWIRLQCIQHHSSGISNGTYDYTITICKANGNTWNWHWGWSGFELVSEGVRDMQHKIVDACKEWCSRTGVKFPGKGW